MKKQIKYIFCLFFIGLVYSTSCNKKSTNDSITISNDSVQNISNTVNSNIESKALEMSIEIDDNEPCDNLALTINGGTPFTDAKKPFKVKLVDVETKEEDEPRLIEFKKISDTEYTAALLIFGMYDSIYQLVVEDANGISKSVTYTYRYCP